MTPLDDSITEPRSRQRTLFTARLVGLTIALVISTAFWWPSVASRLLPTDLVWRNVAAQAADWMFCLVLIAIVVCWERRPLTSLGFKPLNKDNLSHGLALGGFFMVGMIVWQWIWAQLVSGEQPTGRGALPSEFPEHFFLWYGPFALITASFCEEVIYRGYAMERLLCMTDRRWPGIVLPHIAFALMHYKDGFDKVVMVGIVGLLFVFYYLRFRDLTMTIIAHCFIDSIALVGGLVGTSGAAE